MNYYIDDYIKTYKDTTLAINKAIEDSDINGKIIFSKNKLYISGFIKLKSNIELHLEKGATLKASSNISDFNYLDNDDIKILDIPTFVDCSYNGSPTKFFIYGKDIENVKITGEGIIDGNEEIFYGKQNDHHIDGKFYPRVPLLYLENVNDYELKNINIQRSGIWTIHLVGCNNGLIDSVSIKNNRIFACTDGIDPDHTKNLTIRNCYIESADDCIVLKTTAANKKYGDTSNINISNCILKSTSAAIKFGSESTGIIRDVFVKNIEILDSNRGISFQLRDEGSIYNINFQNINIETKRFSPIEWWGKGEPIFISAVRRYKDTNIGFIKNVSFNNINIDSENGICIYGENNISDINFNNINMMIKSKTNYDKDDYHDLRPCYLENSMIRGKCHYIYSSGAKNIKISNYNFNISDNFKEFFESESYGELLFK